MPKPGSFPLSRELTLQFAPAFVPPAPLTARIEEIWAAEKSQRGNGLTNGQIYSLVEYHKDRLVLRPTEYRYALARWRDPSLAEAGLNIRAVGVTGILSCADGLVLGLRGKGVVTYSGWWELVPSGSLECPDPVAQILGELREEVGLDASRVEVPEICGLVADDTDVFDIVLRLKTSASAKEIYAAHKNASSEEYSELAVIPPNCLYKFLEQNKEHLLPTLHSILKFV